MMRDAGRIADVKIGAFVLSALAILVVGSLWIAGSTLFGSPRVPYTVMLENSAGLAGGDRIRVAGVSVGRIRRVELRPEDPFPVVLFVGIKKGVPVHSDAVAGIATTGLLGSAFLEIDPGSTSAPLLPPDGVIHGTRRPGLDEAMGRLDEISGKVGELIDQTSDAIERASDGIGPILSKLERMLAEENSDNFKQILASLRETLDDSGPRIASLLTRLESVAGQLERGTEELPALTAKVETLIDDAHGALGPDGERLARVLEAAEGGLGSADEAFSILGDNRVEIEAALRDLRDTVANLKALSGELKERPFRLVRIKAEPDRKPGEGVK